MAIKPDDLTPVSEDVARRVIATALSIAPGLATLTGDAKATAISILKGVAADSGEPGARRVKSLSRNGTSMSFDTGSAFSADDRAALRALVGAGVPGLPAGSFPEAGTLGRTWTEGEYT